MISPKQLVRPAASFKVHRVTWHVNGNWEHLCDCALMLCNQNSRWLIMATKCLDLNKKPECIQHLIKDWKNLLLNVTRQPLLDIFSTCQKKSFYIFCKFLLQTDCTVCINILSFLCLKHTNSKNTWHVAFFLSLWYNYLRNSEFSVIMSKLERASGSLSSDFGVIRIRG
jgi:hypothetical protein